MKPYFEPVIRAWPTVVAFAAEVGCTVHSAREWVRIDSIPGGWFAAIERAAAAQPDAKFQRITANALSERAEARRLGQVPTKLAA